MHMNKNPSTILIADDEQAMREALGELLIEEGYDVEFARNGTEAVTKAAEIVPDLVLLDVMMPDMDGFAVCRNLRADKLLAQVPIIIITSLGDRASRIKGFEAGADDYVSKPIDESELLARVKTTTHLNRYRKILEEQISREMAEEALKISEVRYRELFDRVPVGLYRSTPDGETLDANPALIEMLGYPDLETRLASNAVDDYVDPQDHQRWQAMMEREGTVRGFETQLRRQDGTPIWVQESARLIRDEKGEVLYHEGAVEDITERKQAEEALEHSLQKAAHGQALLLALSKAAQAVQRARTPKEVYQTIGEEIAKLGYRATIFDLTEDGKHLTVGYMSFESDVAKAAEKLVGLSAQDYRVRLTPGGFYERLISEGEPVFRVPDSAPLAEALPKAAHPLADKLADLLGIHQAIHVPLKTGDRTHALLAVMGANLTEDDIPAMTAFANQAAIAVTNAQLYQAASQERDKAQQYLDIAGVILVAINAKGEITLINRKGCEILGYKEHEILGKNWFDTCLPSENKKTVKSVFSQLIAGETEPAEYDEHPVLTKSGEERLIAWRNTMLRDQAGNIVGTLSSGEDITERVRSERKRAQAEEAYRALVDHSLQGLAILQDRRVVFANQAMADIGGYTMDELRALSPEEGTIHPEDHEAVLERYQDQLEGKSGPKQFAFRSIHKDGTVRWLEAYSNRIEYQGRPAVQTAYIDITERVRSEQKRTQAEKALRESEETARALLNATNDLAILITPSGAILASNEMAAQAVGVGVGEMIGATIADFTSPDLLEIWTAQANQVQSSGKAARFQAERQGTMLDISIHPVFDAQGELVRFAVFARDVTEQIKVRQAIEQRNRELAALNEVGQAIVSTLDLQEMLTLIAEHTNQLMGMAATSVVLREEADDGLYFAAASGAGANLIVGQRLAIDQGIAGWVIQHGKPVLIPDVSQDARWYGNFDAQTGFVTHSILCVPLTSKDRTVGALEALNKPDGFTQDDLRLLSTMAAPVAAAIENARLFKQVRVGREQLQSLSRRLVEMQEVERAHVARELHDEAGQALSGMLLSLSLLEREADQPEAVSSRANELLVLVDDMLENLHRLAMNLRPATLDHLGLLPALEQYVETFEEQYGIETQFEVVNLGSGRLSPELETALYRIVQESLTNIVRHAKATRVDVLVARRDDQVVTIIEDNGGGFDPEMAMQTSRLGLLGIRERAEMLNGRLVIESAPGSGTTVLVEVPYQAA